MEFLQTDVRTQIDAHINKLGIRYSAVARAIGCSSHHLIKVLATERVLTEENLKRINLFLETDFKRNSPPDPITTSQTMKATG